MPPKRLRRPAAAGVPPGPARPGGVRGRAKAKAKAKALGLPRRRRRGFARPAAEAVDPLVPTWTDIKDVKPSDLVIGETYLMKVWYGQEEGQIHAELKEETKDEEGVWLGVQVKGTHLHQLRSFVVSKTGQGARVYLAKTETELGHRRNVPGLGYLLSFRRVLVTDREGWMDNCLDHHLQEVENQALQGVAEKFGFPPQAPEKREDGGAEESEEEKTKKKKGKKKISGREKVRKMLLKAKWDPTGTPLDPLYKKPIKLRVQKKRGSSSSGSGSSSSEPSSEDGLGSEHRLKTIWRRLPGYLTRCSAKEGKRLLAEASGESPQSMRIFYRYYRQSILPRGGSKGIQRELLTHSMLLDMILEGNILSAADVMCQRIKALELMLQGSDVSLARQLELLPVDQHGLAADTEARYAQKQFSAETKLQKQLRKDSSYPSGKGSWSSPSFKDRQEGKGKSKRPWEKGRGKEKGQKAAAETTKVVPPQQ